MCPCTYAVTFAFDFDSTTVEKRRHSWHQARTHLRSALSCPPAGADSTVTRRPRHGTRREGHGLTRGMLGRHRARAAHAEGIWSSDLAGIRLELLLVRPTPQVAGVTVRIRSLLACIAARHTARACGCGACSADHAGLDLRWWDTHHTPRGSWYG